MRIALLWTVLVIGTGVFVAMLVTLWHHRPRASTPGQPGAILDYIWAMVPWLIVALSATPAVQRILATG